MTSCGVASAVTLSGYPMRDIPSGASSWCSDSVGDGSDSDSRMSAVTQGSCGPVSMCFRSGLCKQFNRDDAYNSPKGNGKSAVWPDGEERCDQTVA